MSTPIFLIIGTAWVGFLWCALLVGYLAFIDLSEAFIRWRAARRTRKYEQQMLRETFSQLR